VGGFVSDLVRTDPSALDVRRGIIDAVVLVLPLLIGFSIDQAQAGVLVTVGALNFALVEAATPAVHRWRVLAVTVLANSLAFGAGTVVGLTPYGVEIPLVGVSIFLTLLGTRSTEWENSCFIAAVMFAFAVGIPPSTISGALLRPTAVLLGGALSAAVFASIAGLARRWSSGPLPPLSSPRPIERKKAVRAVEHSAVVAVTVVAGLVVGHLLGLPRDYWVMVTVLVALRYDLAGTLAYSAARIVGTIAGAACAYVVTSVTADPWILFPALALTTGLTLAMRAVNYVAYSVWITLTVILLLNLVYSGGPSLAIARVIDTVIGGGLSLIAAGLLAILLRRRQGAGEAFGATPLRASTTPR
jgi:uncharacterized membrane protein YccC